MSLNFEASEGGFSAEKEGFSCFVMPEIVAGKLQYKWEIMEGGGWTYRGGDSVTVLASGYAMEPSFAEDRIVEWINNNTEE